MEIGVILSLEVKQSCLSCLVWEEPGKNNWAFFRDGLLSSLSLLIRDTIEEFVNWLHGAKGELEDWPVVKEVLVDAKRIPKQIV